MTDSSPAKNPVSGKIPPDALPVSLTGQIDWLRLVRSRRVGPATFVRLLREHGSAADALAALPGWREITVEAGQRFDDILIMEDGNGAASTEIQRIRINIGDAAHCTIFGVIASRDYARVEIEVTLGCGAHFEMGGVTVGGRETVREFVTHVIHAQHARECEGKTAYHGVA